MKEAQGSKNGWVRALRSPETLFTAALATVAAGMIVVGLRKRGLDQVPLIKLLPGGVRLAALVVVGIAAAALLVMAIKRLVTPERLLASDEAVDAASDASKTRFTFTRRGILLATALLLVCWLPWLIIQFPTSMPWDTYNQIVQFLTPAPTLYSQMSVFVPGEFVDHHPVFDSLVFGAFYWVGIAVGNENVGLLLYSIVQMLFTAFVMALSVCYLQRLHCSRRVQTVLLVLVCVYPLCPQYAATMLKDSLFSACYVPFFMCVVETWRTDCAALRNRKFVVAYALCALLVCLTKKPGLLVVGATTLAFLVKYRRRGIAQAVGLGAAMVTVMFVVPAFVYPLLGGVSPGGRQETLGPLFQQSVTVVLEDGNITEEERAALDGILDLDAAMKRYSPTLSDGVKNTFRSETGTEEMLAFAKAWFTIGLKNPLTYLKATLRCSGPLFFPGWKLEKYYRTPILSESYIAIARDREGIVLNYMKPAWSEALANKAYGLLKKLFNVPLLDLALSSGIYAWATMVLIALSVLKGRGAAVCWAPQVLSLVVLLVSPVADTRYALPLALTLVLSFGVLTESMWRKVSEADAARLGIEDVDAAKAGTDA